MADRGVGCPTSRVPAVRRRSRMCIGRGFAELDTSVLLATIGRMWRLEHDAARRVDLQPVVTLRPRDGMPMRTPIVVRSADEHRSGPRCSRNVPRSVGWKVMKDG